MKHGLIIAALLTSLTVAVQAESQTVEPAATPAVRHFLSARTALERGNAFSEVVSVLRGDIRLSRAFRDSVGAEITEVAIRARPADGLTGSDAVAALVVSSRPQAGKHYEGAFHHLRRIFEHADDIGIRGAALNGISKNHDRDKALKFLQTVARDAGEPNFSMEAVVLIFEKFGREGTAFLIELDRKGGAGSAQAKAWLQYQKPNLERRLKDL